MQILIQTICSKGRSLREAIANDARWLEAHHLQVLHQKRPGRQHGWAKLRSTLPGRHGAINLEWDSGTRVLLSRVVTRGNGKPHGIIGDYVAYLLDRHARRIQSIHLVPRK